MIQTGMSTTAIITLQSGKSPCAPAIVLVLPKNEETKYRSPAVGSQLMWAWKCLEVREKVKMWMSPSATPQHHFEWDREKKKMAGRKPCPQRRRLGGKDFDENEGGNIAAASRSHFKLCVTTFLTLGFIVHTRWA